MRGFDQEEVSAYLNKLADDVELISDENQHLKNRLQATEKKLQELQQMEEHLKNALLKAQRDSDVSLDEARRKAALILEEAQMKADAIIKNAEEKAEEVEQSTTELKKERNLLLARLKGLVGSHAGLIKDFTDNKKTTGSTNEDEQQNRNDINVNKIAEKLV